MSKELYVQLTTPTVDATSREQVTLAKILDPEYMARPAIEIIDQMADSNLNGPHQEPYNTHQQHAASVLEAKLQDYQTNQNTMSLKIYNLNQTDDAPANVLLQETLPAAYLGEKVVLIDSESRTYKLLKLEINYSTPGGSCEL